MSDNANVVALTWMDFDEDPDGPKPVTLQVGSLIMSRVVCISICERADLVSHVNAVELVLGTQAAADLAERIIQQLVLLGPAPIGEGSAP